MRNIFLENLNYFFTTHSITFRLHIIITFARVLWQALCAHLRADYAMYL